MGGTDRKGDELGNPSMYKRMTAARTQFGLHRHAFGGTNQGLRGDILGSLTISRRASKHGGGHHQKKARNR